MELGLEKLESEDNPLHTNDEFPRFGLVEEAEALCRNIAIINHGEIVEHGSIDFDDRELQLAFQVTDSLETYPVQHSGTPPELFQENTGVVVEGRFEDGVFVSDNLLVKHSEVYEAPAEGQHIDLEELKDTLQ